MRHTLNALFAVLGLTAAACGEAHESGAEVPLEEFCESFDGALLNAVSRCGCADDAARSIGTCSSSILSPAVSQAVREGHLDSHPRAAHRLMAKLERSCDPMLSTLRDQTSFGGVWTGTRAPGQACESLALGGALNTCENGACVDGACVEYASVGESCDEQTLCVDLDRSVLGDARGALLPCRDGTCVEKVASGGTCEASHECATGRCLDGRCLDKEPIGGSCGAGVDCESGFCDDGTCAAGMKDIGSDCRYGAECASDYCAEASVCGEALCRELR